MLSNASYALSPTITIYAMVDWNNPDVVRYVGKTQEALKKRLQSHIYCVNRHRCPKNDWLKHLFRNGSFPVMLPLEVCNSDIWESRERFWISELRKQFPLLNVSDGGDCGPSRKGCKQPAHFIEAMRARKTWIGRKHKPESIEKIRAAKQREHLNHPERIAKMIAASVLVNKGKKRPQSVIDKIISVKTTNGTLRAGIYESAKARQKPVRCVETDQVFPSIKSACQISGVSNTAIHQALKTKGCPGGYHWERIQNVCCP